MTYIIRMKHGERDEVRTFANAVDAVAAIDVQDASPLHVSSVDRMGEPISEAELRADAAHERSRQPLHLPDVSTP